MKRGLQIGFGGMLRGCAERQGRFDFAAMRANFSEEAIQKQRLDVHVLGDDHAAHRDEDDDLGLDDAEQRHDSENSAGTGSHAEQRERVGAGQLRHAAAHDGGGDEDHDDQDGNSSPPGTAQQDDDQKADEQNLNDTAQQDEGNFVADFRSASGGELGDDDGQHGDGGGLAEAERHLGVKQEIKHAATPARYQSRQPVPLPA